MKIRIYLDLDDVLADFVSQMCLLHNVPPRPFHLHRKKMDIWNCAPLLKDLSHTWDHTLPDQDAFWLPLEHGQVDETEFWANLAPMPWKSNLIDLVRSFDPEFKVITTPSRRIDSYIGKLRWLTNHAPQLNLSGSGHVCSKRIRFMSEKEELSKPGRILIDDNPHTIYSWQKEGGDGILFPLGVPEQTDLENPVEYVYQQLVRITGIDPNHTHHL